MILCGRNESCFEQDSTWEEFVCKYYYEEYDLINDRCVQMCDKYICEVESYLSKYQYDELIKKRDFSKFIKEFCNLNSVYMI